MASYLRFVGCALSTTFVLAMGSVPATAADEVKILVPQAIDFKPSPDAPGVSLAVVSGNPKEGTYTIRARFAGGTKIPAHFHPDTRTVTVLSGTYYFGAGDRFDDGAIRGYGPGTVIVVPAGAAHYSWSKDGEVVVQESGLGPTGLTLTGK